MSLANDLESLAQQLFQLAHSLNGGPEVSVNDIGFAQYMQNPKAYPGYGWAYMQAQFKAQDQPHEYVQWAQGVLPGQAGTGEDWIKKYQDWRPMQQNAEQAGQLEAVVNLIPKGEAAYVAAFTSMYYSAWGQDWLANPATAGMRPKFPPGPVTIKP